MNNHIKKMLRIIDPNLIISDISYEIIKKRNTTILHWTYSPAPTPCQNCGSTVFDSHGKIEAKNTHIKTLKRVSYGFKSFENMKLRIFMINHFIEIREQKNYE